MCQPASFVVTKNKVFWSTKSESHSDIIEENKLKEASVRGNILFVRVEIIPPDRDYTLPLKQWQFHLDQDMLPQWYDAKDVERRCRAELKAWRKRKIIMPNESRKTIDTSHIVAIYGTVENIKGGTVENIKGGTVENIKGGTVENIKGGTVENIHGGTVKNIDGGTVKNINGGTVEHINGGTVKNINGGTVKNIWGGTVKNIDGGTVKNIWGGTVEHINGGTVENINGGTVKNIDGGTVKNIYGGTVEYIDGGFPTKVTGNAIVINHGSLTPTILQSKGAVMIDRRGGVTKCYVGTKK